MRGPSYSEVAQALNDEPERWAPVIIGEEPNKAMSSSRELRFYQKGGLVVKLQGAKRGNWSHHGHDRYGDMLDLIQYIRSVSKKEAFEIAKDMLGLGENPAIELKPRKSAEELADEQRQEDEKRIRTARFIWSKSSTKLSPAALAYLEARAITRLGRERVPSVRCRKLDRTALEKMHIEAPGTPARFPNGLDALVFGATTNSGAIVSVQQIILDGAKKADIANKKRSNGLMEGAAVRLGPAPQDDLDVAEGPETGVSCWEATDCPTWIALGASNLCRIPVPGHVKRMRFAVEIEATRTGIRSALRAAYHWMRRGKECRLAMPRVPSDMNDVHRTHGLEAVREDMENALAPERNPFRDASGRLLGEDTQNDLPMILTLRADDALAAWLSTGLGCMSILQPRDERDATEGSAKDIKSIGHLIPEGVRKALIVLCGNEKEPQHDDLPPGVTVRIVRLTMTLEDLRRVGGGEAVRRALRLNTDPGKLQPIGVENLALRPEGPVIVTTGRGAAEAAARLFPQAAVVGMSTSVSSRDVDWSILARRDVLVAPANREDHILAAEQAASDMIEAGAERVRLARWPTIRPMRGGWRARAELPEGYDLRWLEAEGWTAEDAAILFRLAEPAKQAIKSAA